MAKTFSLIPIKDALESSEPSPAIQVQGWVRTRRDSKDFSFIELNDGSSLRNLQIIAKNTLSNYDAVQRLTTGASIIVQGELVPSQGKGQNWEVVAEQVRSTETGVSSSVVRLCGCAFGVRFPPATTVKFTGISTVGSSGSLEVMPNKAV